MANITLRSVKGTALTFEEGDNNFSNLNSAKLESVSEDTAPSLGGDLDVGANSIVTSDQSGFIQLGNPIEIAGVELAGPGELFSVITGAADSDFVLLTNGGDFASPAMFMVPDLNNPEIFFAMTVGGEDVLNIKDNLVFVRGELSINETEYAANEFASILKSNSTDTPLFLQNNTVVNAEIHNDRIQLNQPVFIKGLPLAAALGDANTLFGAISGEPGSITVIGSNGGDFFSPLILLEPEVTEVGSEAPAQISFSISAGESDPLVLSQGLVEIDADLEVNGTINNFTFPATDGTAGQVLTTNGAGVLDFERRVASQDVFNIERITQANYDALNPPVATTLYLIEEV